MSNIVTARIFTFVSKDTSCYEEFIV